MVALAGTPYFERPADFVRFIRETIRRGLRESDQPREAMHAIKEVTRLASGGIEGSRARERWHCKAGCSFCCKQFVSVSAIEVLRIAERLRTLVEPEAYAPLVERIERRVRSAQLVSDEDLFYSNLACGLLNDDDTCAAYAERPLVCRGCTSFDVAACASSVGHTVAELKADKSTIPMDRFAIQVTSLTRFGIYLACRDAGLDTRAYELNDVLLVSLRTKDAARRWLGGEDVFAACRLDHQVESNKSAWLKELNALDELTK